MTAGDSGGFVGTIKIGWALLVCGGGGADPAMACVCATAVVAATLPVDADRVLNDMAIILFAGDRNREKTESRLKACDRLQKEQTACQ